MKVTEFVEGFKQVNDKEKYVKKHVVRTYVKFEDKLSEAKKIVDRSLHIDGINGDDQIFCYQTPNRYLLFMISVFMKYTDIEFSDRPLDDFNLIEEHNISEYVVKQIGNDYQRFQTILSMVYDDAINNERDIVSYIDRKYQAFVTMVEYLSKLVPEEGIVNGEH